MDKLRLFSTQADYEDEAANLEYPTVSYIENGNGVAFTAKPDYSTMYLTFEALESGTFTLYIPSFINETMTSVSYSTDKGTTWTTTNITSGSQTITTPTINAGDKVLWKGIGNAMCVVYSGGTKYYCKFVSTGEFVVSGNIMSLLHGDNFINQYIMPSGTTYNFYGLFYRNSKLLSAKNLILPATTLTNYCYNEMFFSCTSLTTAPATLPATTLANYCYQGMFYDCTALTTAPQLPATTMAYACYQTMFNGCTSLTIAPQLPATTLANNCYSAMFTGCTSLTTAPVLPVTTLADYCYQNMFTRCTSLTTAPALPATTLATSCYSGMFYNCTSLTTAPALPATTLAQNCYNGMFYGTNVLPDCSNIDFTSQTVVASGGLQGLFEGTKVTYNNLLDILPLDGNNKPCLPVTTLAKNCYHSMFQGCTSLTTAPQLPATTLANYCYQNMFQGCTSLTTTPALPATTLANGCYIRMFRSCTALTTAPALPATTLAQSCYEYIFEDCTSLTTAPVLSATTLAFACYRYMFNGCSNLNYIKAMFTTTPSSSYTNNWVSGVAATGTFVKNSAAQWNVTGTYGVPSGWTVQTASE